MSDDEFWSDTDFYLDTENATNVRNVLREVAAWMTTKDVHMIPLCNHQIVVSLWRNQKNVITKMFRATGTCPECVAPARIKCRRDRCCTLYCSAACRNNNASEHASVCGPLDAVPHDPSRMLGFFRKFATTASQNMVVDVLPCPDDSFRMRIHDSSSVPPAPNAVPAVLMPGVTVMMNPPPTAEQIYVAIYVDAIELETGMRSRGNPNVMHDAMAAWAKATPRIRERFEEKARITQQKFASSLEQLHKLSAAATPASVASTSTDAAAAAGAASTSAKTATISKMALARPTTCMHISDSYYYCSCREAVYCNKECQRMDWPTHKATCKVRLARKML